MMVRHGKAVERPGKITMPALAHWHQAQHFFRQSRRKQRNIFSTQM
jgi:hypothetical protein